MNEIEAAFQETFCELNAAMTNWPEFASAHEGYAILLEEVDELWEHVKQKPQNRDQEAMRAEAIQVAAMALRFAIDLTPTLPGSGAV